MKTFTDTELLDYLDRQGRVTASAHPDHPNKLLFMVFLNVQPPVDISDETKNFPLRALLTQAAQNG